MARCQCAGSSCSCLIQAGPGTSVTGVGTASQPYIISSTPYYHSFTFTSSAYYYLNRPGVSDIGSRAVFDFDLDGTSTAYVFLPDGSVNAPYPAVGAEFDMIFTGSPGDTINFAGPVRTWYGHDSGPSNTMGWYRFIFLGTRYAAQYIGPSYTP